MADHTIFLLGAGASREAGIPLTVEMTRDIMDVINNDMSRRWDGTAAAINFVCGQIIGHRSGQGVSPFDAVDVERLFSAVSLLANRADHEAAPFVHTWHPSVDGFGAEHGTVPRGFGSNLKQALYSRWDTDVERVMNEALRSLSGEPRTYVYERLLEVMTGALRRVVVVKEGVDYLSPIFDVWQRQGRLTVATLNYDVTIETLAKQRGVSVDTGVAHWSATGEWDWHPTDLRLLKLHGSIDWSKTHKQARGALAHPEIEISLDFAADNDPPFVVFGERGKVTAEGPFLELLMRFAADLDEANRLVVVGYSMRDDHINEYIRRWLNKDDSRRLVVIDPDFKDPQGYEDTFQWQLVVKLRTSPPPPPPPGVLAPGVEVAPSEGESRLEIIRSKASVGLRKVADAL